MVIGGLFAYVALTEDHTGYDLSPASMRTGFLLFAAAVFYWGYRLRQKSKFPT